MIFLGPEKTKITQHAFYIVRICILFARALPHSVHKTVQDTRNWGISRNPATKNHLWKSVTQAMDLLNTERGLLSTVYVWLLFFNFKVNLISSRGL